VVNPGFQTAVDLRNCTASAAAEFPRKVDPHWRSAHAPLELVRGGALPQACARVARYAWAFNFLAFGPLILAAFVRSGVNPSLFTLLLIFGFETDHPRAQGRIGLGAGFQTAQGLRDCTASTGAKDQTPEPGLPA